MNDKIVKIEAERDDLHNNLKQLEVEYKQFVNDNTRPPMVDAETQRDMFECDACVERKKRLKHLEK